MWVKSRWQCGEAGIAMYLKAENSTGSSFETQNSRRRRANIRANVSGRCETWTRFRESTNESCENLLGGRPDPWCIAHVVAICSRGIIHRKA